MYVYLISNLVNDNMYVGQTIRPPRARWVRHIYDSDNGSELSLHRAFRKYGIDNFKFEVIDECLSMDELNEAERKWITKLNTFYNGYNMTSGGDGYIVSDEVKEKQSLTRCGISNGFYGKVHTSESLTKMKKRHNERLCGKKPKPVLKNRSLSIKMGTSVHQLKDNIILRTFHSIRDASRETDIDSSAITKVCKGKRNFAGGYFWRYV